MSLRLKKALKSIFVLLRTANIALMGYNSQVVNSLFFEKSLKIHD